MVRKFLLPALLSTALVMPVISVAAADDEPRYSTWEKQSEAGENEQLSALANELNALIDAAAEARAADPVFLQDMRDKIAEYLAAAAAAPAPEPVAQRVVLFSDDFSDGNYTRRPEWTVVDGDFTVDGQLGLRTVVRLEPASAEKSSGPSIDEISEKAKSVFDDIIGGKDEPEQDTAPAEAARAEIFAAQTISNSFALDFEMTSRIASEGTRLEVDIFQGRNRNSGYRLSYHPGDDPAFILSRFGRSGVFEIAEYDDPMTLEDGYTHKISLSRAADGLMVVTVDGQEIIKASSQAFTDSFDGLAIVNSGGDYAFRAITVHGGA